MVTGAVSPPPRYVHSVLSRIPTASRSSSNGLALVPPATQSLYKRKSLRVCTGWTRTHEVDLGTHTDHLPNHPGRHLSMLVDLHRMLLTHALALSLTLTKSMIRQEKLPTSALGETRAYLKLQ